MSEPTAEATKPSWEPRFTRSLISALTEVEAEVTRPTGLRRIFRGGLTFFCNLLPPIVLLGSIGLVLYQLFAMDPPAQASIPLMLLPLYATLAVLVAVHLLVIIALPIRWSSIREQFRARLKVKLAAELGEVYRNIPDDLAKSIRDEKTQTEALVTETKQVADWLREREGAAGVADLYGK